MSKEWSSTTTRRRCSALWSDHIYIVYDSPAPRTTNNYYSFVILLLLHRRGDLSIFNATISDRILKSPTITSCPSKAFRIGAQGVKKNSTRYESITRKNYFLENALLSWTTTIWFPYDCNDIWWWFPSIFSLTMASNNRVLSTNSSFPISCTLLASLAAIK